MAKYEYGLEETLKFRKYMTIETDLPEEELFKILDHAECHADTAEDVAHLIEIEGVKVVKFPDNDYNSPHDVEVDEWDFEQVE